MEFRECPASLGQLRAHLKEEVLALGSRFPPPAKALQIPKDLHTGQTNGAAVCSKSSCHGYTLTLLHLYPAEKLLALILALLTTLATRFLSLLMEQ